MPQPRIQQDPAEGPRGRTSAGEDDRGPAGAEGPEGAAILSEPAEGDRETVERNLRDARGPKGPQDGEPR